MNSVEALEYASRLVRLEIRKLDSRVQTSDKSRAETAMKKSEAEDALETLTALREVVIDNDRKLAEDREIREEWVERAGVPLRETPYAKGVTCHACNGTDRVLLNWAHKATDYPYPLCIDCRRRIIRES